jgi:hypothetical protein
MRIAIRLDVNRKTFESNSGCPGKESTIQIKLVTRPRETLTITGYKGGCIARIERGDGKYNNVRFSGVLFWVEVEAW